ncbi:LysR family transcriptional regulator [Lactobacillus sp. CBA3606]|uniref:LysR family transcriptional regulator n=1 Tax=Lactobacillus sp. CBA3606 TaxID=2099789 RepID=UPI000CFC09E9|nr:LysR substrate-binding domain-containing protein [Lactobacillus sp. CBA3606]AVK64184.1 LysR family transcriptional regulator [Lactobacillus sp. CBA3606]
MEIRVLRYFLTVIQEQNISRAATKLHISQPTISRQLHDLEDELDVTLFERGSRTIALTASGTYFAQQARQIVALADKTIYNIQKTTTLSGNVSIGGGEVPSITTIAQAAKTLTNQHPQVTFQLSSLNADDVKRQLAAGLLDFGLLVGHVDKERLNFINLPSHSHWGLLLPKTSTLAKHAQIVPTDLFTVPLMMSYQRGVNTEIADWFGQNITQLNVIATYNLLYNATKFVEAGIGAAIAIEGIYNTASTALAFVPLADIPPVAVNLVWSKDLSLTTAAQAFLHAVQEALAPS